MGFDSLFEQTCQDIHAEEEATEEARVRKGRRQKELVAMEERVARPPGEMHAKEEALGLLAGGGAAAGLERRARRATVRPEARAHVVGKDPGGRVGQSYVAAVSEYVRQETGAPGERHNYE